MTILNKNLLRFNFKNKKFICIDTETNGLNLFYSEPFNVGFNIYSNDKIEESQNLYVDIPNYKISSELAKKVHYDESVIKSQGKTAKEVYSLLKKYLDNKDYFIIGSNYLNYDAMVIKNSAERCGVNIGYDYLDRVYDCNSLFKALKLNVPPDNKNLLSFQWKMNSIVKKGLKSSVGFACKEFGIEYNHEEAHSAIYDVTRSHQIFKNLIERIDLI